MAEDRRPETGRPETGRPEDRRQKTQARRRRPEDAGRWRSGGRLAGWLAGRRPETETGDGDRIPETGDGD